MPEALHRKLKAQAEKKGFGKERTGAYVYGTLEKEVFKRKAAKLKAKRKKKKKKA